MSHSRGDGGGGGNKRRFAFSDSLGRPPFRNTLFTALWDQKASGRVHKTRVLEVKVAALRERKCLAPTR